MISFKVLFGPGIRLMRQLRIATKMSGMGLFLLVPLQMAHALTFAASHIGAIHYLTRTVPEHQMGTAQALYSAVTGGLATGVVMLSIGPLYANFGGRAYWAMALVSLIGLAASLAIGRSRSA